MTELDRLELREGKWASLVLSSDVLEHPKADIKVSFTQEYLHIKAAVNDLHFKDGERSCGTRAILVGWTASSAIGLPSLFQVGVLHCFHDVVGERGS